MKTADTFPVKVLGTQEAAKRLGLTTTRIATMIRTGIIEAQKIGHSWVINETEIDRIAKKARPPGRQKKKS